MLVQDNWGYRLPYPVRYPVELHPPPGFRPEVAESWPRVEGRLEYTGGRLLYMPPCGDIQQAVAMDAAYLLMTWGRLHPEFVIGGNEAGMVLDGETRAADAAVWSRAAAGEFTGGFRRVPPILAVEIAGQDEGEPELRSKSAWYLGRGARVVWLVLPQSREVVVLMQGGESRHGVGESLPAHPDLPGLTPPAAEFFRQLG